MAVIHRGDGDENAVCGDLKRKINLFSPQKVVFFKIEMKIKISKKSFLLKPMHSGRSGNQQEKCLQQCHCISSDLWLQLPHSLLACIVGPPHTKNSCCFL